MQPEIDRLIVTFAKQKKLWENYQTKNKAAFGTAFGISSIGSAWYVGGLLSLTPAAPTGWLIVLSGSGAAIYVTTDYVDAGEYREFKNFIRLQLIAYNR